MNRHAAFHILPCFALVLAILVPPVAADPPAETCRGKACIDYGGVLEEQGPKLPLERATKTKVDKRRDKEKAAGKKHQDRIHPQCAAELDKDPVDRDEARIAKFCDKSPGRQKEVLHDRPIRTADGKQRGKAIRTRTTLSPGSATGTTSRIDGTISSSSHRPPET